MDFGKISYNAQKSPYLTTPPPPNTHTHTHTQKKERKKKTPKPMVQAHGISSHFQLISLINGIWGVMVWKAMKYVQ